MQSLIDTQLETQIRDEAVKATLVHSNWKDACRYELGSGEAFLFCAAFLTERTRQENEILRDTKARANIATIALNHELQHPHSIVSDAISDEAEDALQTAFATAILAGADSIQPIKD